MSYHELNNNLYQIEGCAGHVSEALSVLSGAKLTKKQRDALAIIEANTDFITKTSHASRTICSERLDAALQAMQEKATEGKTHE